MYRRGGVRTGAVQKHFAKALNVLILADQLPHILAARAVTTHVDLLVDKRLERIRKRDVHRRHKLLFSVFGKIWQYITRLKSLHTATFRYLPIGQFWSSDLVHNSDQTQNIERTFTNCRQIAPPCARPRRFSPRASCRSAAPSGDRATDRPA